LAHALNLRAARAAITRAKRLLVQLALHLLSWAGSRRCASTTGARNSFRNVRDDAALRAAWREKGP
jgi:hypothetical protein